MEEVKIKITKKIKMIEDGIMIKIKIIEKTITKL